MSKYIDAEKLKKIVEQAKQQALKGIEVYGDFYYDGRTSAFGEVLLEIDSLQQEQPEVDLEKFTEKIKTFQGRYKHPEIVSIKGAMAFMARMFYQYPNVARQWYEQLPKATMD